MGLTLNDVRADRHATCQRVGGATAWLGCGGLLVPSARAQGSNLIILVGLLGLEDDLVVITQEAVEDHTAP